MNKEIKMYLQGVTIIDTTNIDFELKVGEKYYRVVYSNGLDVVVVKIDIESDKKIIDIPTVFYCIRIKKDGCSDRFEKSNRTDQLIGIKQLSNLKK